MTKKFYYILIASSLGVFYSDNALSQPREVKIHVWLRAFIPSSIKDGDYIKKASDGTYVIKAPGLSINGQNFGYLAGSCFSTDNRDFSSDLGASSRVMADFIIKFTGRRTMAVELANGRSAYGIIGQTHNVNCDTGKDISPPKSASTDSVVIGQVKVSDFMRVFNVKVSAGNPFYAGLAPAINYEFAVQYDVASTSINFHGTSGNFPAFEGYYEVNGQTKPIFKLPPASGSTPLSLTDLWLGLNSRSFDYRVDLTPYLVR